MRRPTRTSRLLPAALLLALSAPARAQHVLHDLPGAAAGDLFGSSVAGGLDVDGDGRPDLLVGARRSNAGALNAGRVEVRSGLSGLFVLAVNGAAPGDSLGHSVAFVGDLTGDGAGDFVAGAPFDDTAAFNGGTALVLPGAGGSTLYALPGGEQFGLAGWSVAGCGDVDLDGVPDLIVGAPEEDAGGTDSGAVYVYSGASGVELFSRTGDSGGARLGRSVAGAGDMNGDGHADFMAGADLEDVGPLQGAGAVRVWSGTNGSLLLVKHGTEAGGRLGFAVAGLGDVDGDGRDDVAAGAWAESPSGPESGRVYVWSGASGALLHVLEGAQAGDQLGWSVAAIGDVDGDGRADVLVGAPGEAGGRGAARVYSGATGELLFLTLGAAPGDRLGEAVAGIGDVTGDGRPEWAAGAPFAHGGGASSGRVLVLSAQNPAGSVFCPGDGSGGFCPCGNFGGGGEGCANSTGAGAFLESAGTPSVAADALVLSATGLVPDQPALLYAGINALNGGLGFAFGDGLRCAAGSVQRLGVKLATAGSASWGPGLAAAHGWSAGDVRRVQVWYRDAFASVCGSGFNLSNGFELTLAP